MGQRRIWRGMTRLVTDGRELLNHVAIAEGELVRIEVQDAGQQRTVVVEGAAPTVPELLTALDRAARPRAYDRPPAVPKPPKTRRPMVCPYCGGEGMRMLEDGDVVVCVCSR